MYRGQHTLLTQQFAGYNKGQVKVSAIDAAQGQEADLVIISFIRANTTGIVGFTDDAKRLNVAIARAKAGVIIVGRLATSLAASTSGFRPLFYELHKQGAIYDYQHEDTHPPMVMMTEKVFKMNEAQFLADTTEEQRWRKREGKDRASHAGGTYDTERAPESDITYTVDKTRRYLHALTRSTSFMLAMSHVCSLEQQIEYNNGIPPNKVADWDRKSWSRQNFFVTPGVSADPGNFILGTMFLSICHALGMEPAINPDQQSDLNITGSNRSAPWGGDKCTRHPIVSGSATAGMARKPGYRQVITNMSNQNVQPAECLRIVIETLVHDEKGHQVSLDIDISDIACERMGDVLEAAGGLIDPWTPAAKPFMMTMHDPHGIDATNDTDAFRNLQGLAQGIKESAGMLPSPKTSDGSTDDNRAPMWTIFKELRPDGLTLKPNSCRGCWICNEITRLGGTRLLNEDGEHRALRDVPGRIYSIKKFVRIGRGVRMRVSLGAHLKPRRAWTRDTSNGQSSSSILQRIPAIILDAPERHPEQRYLQMRQVRKSVPRTFPGLAHRGSQTLVVRRTLHGMEARAVDASWFCIDCWADKLDIDSVGRTRDELGLPRASRPSAVLDNRFHQHTDRWSICDNCDCYCTGRARDWLPGSFVYVLHEQLIRRAPQASKGLLPQVARPGDALEKRLVECEVLVQNMPGPAVAEEALGDRPMVDVTQRQSMEGGIDPEALASQQWGRRLAERLERIPIRQLAGRQPERLEVTPQYRI